MIENENNNWRRWLLLLVFVPFMPILPKSFFGFYSEGLLVVYLSVLCLVYFIIYSKEIIELDYYIDSPLILFLTFTIISLLWALNKSLAIYQILNYLQWVLLFYCVRIYQKNDHRRKDIPFLMKAMFWIPLIIYYIKGHWHVDHFFMSIASIFIKSGNEATAYFSMLLPFVLFDNRNCPRNISFSRVKDFAIKTLAIVGSFYFTYSADTAGSLICISLVTGLYIWSINQVKILKIPLVIFALLSVIFLLILMLFPSTAGSNDVLLEFSLRRNGDRIMMIRNSLLLFWDHFLSGVGVGNWPTHVFGDKMDDFAEMNNSILYKRYSSHNFFSKVLAEHGVVGLFFMTYIGIKLVGSFMLQDITTRQKKIEGYIILLVTTPVVLNLYAHADLRADNFSNCFLIVVICLAYVLGKSKKVWVRIRLYWLLPVSLLILAYSVFYYRCDYNILNMYMTWPGQKNRLEILENNYHVGYYGKFRNRDVALEIAKLYASSDWNRALLYFREGLESDPYNIELLTGIAEHLMKEKPTIEEAEQYLLKAREIQPNYIYTTLLLAELYHETDSQLFHSEWEKLVLFKKLNNRMVSKKISEVTQRQKRLVKEAKNINSRIEALATRLD